MTCTRACVVVLVSVLACCALLANVAAAVDVPDEQLQPVPKGYKLTQVTLMTRHGDRTPYSLLPGSHHVEYRCAEPPFSSINPGALVMRKQYMDGRNQLPGNCTLGMLTHRGYLQELANGALVRRRYVEEAGLLPFEYDPSIMYIRSTDVPRTIASAQGVLHGLWPDLLTREHTRAPLPLNMVENAVERMVPKTGSCPALAAEWNRLRAQPEWQQHMAAMQPLGKRVAAALGVQSVGADRWPELWDNFNCRLAHGKPLPGGITRADVEALKHENEWEMRWLYSTTKSLRMSVGAFMGDVLRRWVEHVADGGDGDTPSLVYYSSHDNGMAGYMSVFGTWNGTWPQYATLLRVELYKPVARGDARPVLFRMVYNGQPQTVPGCSGEFCEFSSLAKRMSPFIPQDIERECYDLSDAEWAAARAMPKHILTAADAHFL